MPCPPITSGGKRWQPEREPYCSALASVKRFGSAMLILTSRETELAELGATRILAGVVLRSARSCLPQQSAFRYRQCWLVARAHARRPRNRGGDRPVAASRPAADPWPWLMTVSAIDGAEGLGAVRCSASEGR